MALADIIQIILSTLSLVATIAVSFSIYWLQTRHEKELRNAEFTRQQHELEEQATRFMIDNSEELACLPWCVVAANVARLQKHTRPIYSNFCRLSPELRDEVLRQAGIQLKTKDIPTNDWVYPCIERLKGDISKYQLGRDVLYDGAKYFFRSQNYFAKEYDFQTRRVFGPIYQLSSFEAVLNPSGKNCIGRYVSDYFRMVLGDTTGILKHQVTPPVNYVWADLGAAETPDESEVCGWVMALIHEITLCMNAYVYKGSRNNTLERDTVDSEILFFEDMYYETLLDLFYTYYAVKEA